MKKRKTARRIGCLLLTGAMAIGLGGCSIKETEHITVSYRISYLGTETDPSTSTLEAVDYDVHVADNRDSEGNKVYVLSEVSPTICYDNLGLGFLAEEDTKYCLELAEGVGVNSVVLSAVDADYNSIDPETLVSWDEDTFTLTALQDNTENGTVFMDLCKGKEVLYTVNVRVVGAYPTDPEYDINIFTAQNLKGNDLWRYNTYGETDENVNVHDPSVTEVMIDGVRYYYMVQTGWTGGNILRRSTDLIHWEYIGKTNDYEDGNSWGELKDWLLCGAKEASFWAADLVPASYGGYWLYTCVVNSAVDEEKHDRVCIVQAWSPDLSANSFEYTGVIVQSISDYAQDALYYNVVALDPQIVYDSAGNMYMTFGSFGAGCYELALDPLTGLRMDGETEWLTEDTINTYMEEARYAAIGEEHPYYGTHITYCAEGSVITHQYDVEIVSEDGTVERTYDDYYYLMTCLGSLTRNYVLFTAGSEFIDSFTNLSGDAMASGWIGKELVTGLFPPISGYRSDLDRESYITTADRIEGSTEYVAMSSFKWSDYAFDVHAPGHGDLYTTSDGVNIALLMVRTLALQSDKEAYCDNGYQLGARSDNFMMQAHQYYINSAGDICINANRYANEAERSISKEEFLYFAKDNEFQMILAGDPYVTTESIYVTLNEDGTIEGDATGTWKLYGDNYIRVDVDGYDTYLGVVAVSWLDNRFAVGTTVTAMGQTTGCPLYMNSQCERGNGR